MAIKNDKLRTRIYKALQQQRVILDNYFKKKRKQLTIVDKSPKEQRDKNFRMED